MRQSSNRNAVAVTFAILITFLATTVLVRCSSELSALANSDVILKPVCQYHVDRYPYTDTYEAGHIPSEYTVGIYRGGAKLTQEELLMTIDEVLGAIPVIPFDKYDNIRQYLLELCIVNGDAGGIPFKQGADNGFYGITALTWDKVMAVMSWTYNHRRDLYLLIDAHIDHEVSLYDNVAYNVPLNLLITTVWSWIYCPHFEEHLNTVSDRAKFYEQTMMIEGMNADIYVATLQQDIPLRFDTIEYDSEIENP